MKPAQPNAAQTEPRHNHRPVALPTIPFHPIQGRFLLRDKKNCGGKCAYK
jgi:hypothetical protein